MCKLLEQEQPSLSEIIASLPTKEKYYKSERWDEDLVDSYDTTYLNQTLLPLLREKTGNCPACILAVLRQAEIPVPAVSDFHFKQGCEDVWSCFNEAQRRKEPW